MPACLQALKNEAELAGMREAHLRDAVALCEFLCDMEAHVSAGREEGQGWEYHWGSLSCASPPQCPSCYQHAVDVQLVDSHKQSALQKKSSA